LKFNKSSVNDDDCFGVLFIIEVDGVATCFLNDDDLRIIPDDNLEPCNDGELSIDITYKIKIIKNIINNNF